MSSKAVEYGIRFTADGKAFVGEVKTTREAVESLGKSGQKAGEDTARGVKQATSEASVLNNALKNVGHYTAAYFGVSQVLSFAKALSDSALAADRLNNTLKFSTGSARAGAEALEYVRQTANRLGLDLATAGSAFAKFAASANGTKMGMSDVKAVFESVSKASVVLGLSAEESNGAMLALSQMMSKGTVNAEELRGQLGERIPGAFNIAARAMGVTTSELGKMLEQGQVISDDFLPKFAAEMERTFGAAAGDAANSAIANVNRLATAWEQFKREFGQASNAADRPQWLIDGLNEASAAMRAGIRDGNNLLAVMGSLTAFIIGASGGGKFSDDAKKRRAVELQEEIQNLQKRGEGGKSYYGKSQDLDQIRDNYKELQGIFAQGKLKLPGLDELKDQAAAQRDRTQKDLEASTKFSAGWVKAYENNAAKKKDAIDKLDGLYAQETARFRGNQEMQVKLASEYADKRAQIDKQFAGKAAKESDFAKFTQEAAQREALLKAETESLTKLTATEVWANKVEADLASGKLKMSAADQVQTRAILEQLKARGAAEQIAEEERQSREHNLKGLESETDAIKKQIETTLYETAIIGKTKEEIALLQSQRGDHTIAIMEEQLAMLDAAKSCTAESEALREQIKVRKELKAVTEGKAAAEAANADVQEAKKANKEMASDFDKTVKEYDDVFRKGFADMVNGGTTTWKAWTKSLTTTFKTTVADQIYKMFVKPIVLQIIASGAGVLGFTGVANAANAAQGSGSSGGIGSWISSGKSVYDIISSGNASMIASATSLGEQAGYWASQAVGASQATAEAMVTAGGQIGAAASYVGAGLAGIAIGSAIAGDKKVLGMDGTTTSTAGAIIGSIVGGPIGGVIGGAIGGLLNAAFGSGPRESGTTTLQGQFSKGGFSGALATPWHEDGGWFSSDSNGIDYQSLSAAQTKGFSSLVSGSKAVFDSLSIASGSAIRSLDGWSYAINRQIATEEQQKQLVIDLSNSMGQRLMPEIAALQAQGESFADTAVRLRDEFILTDHIAVLLGKNISTAFGGVGLASAAMRDNLVNLMGGMPALTSSMQKYYTNFFSSAERYNFDLQAMTTSLSQLGVTSIPQTNAQFRALIESQDLATAAGQQMFASLIGLSDAFNAVTQAGDAASAQAVQAAAEADAAAQAAQTAIASQRRSMEINLMELTGDVAGALAARRADEMAALDSTLQPIQEQINAQTDLGAAYAKATAEMQSMKLLTTDTFATLVDYTRYLRLASNAGISGADAGLPPDAATTFMPGRGGGDTKANTDKELVGAVDDLRAELRAGQIALAQYMAETAKILRRWNGDGMPEVRVVA